MDGAAPKKAWTSRSLGSSFQHQIFYALIRAGGRRAAYLLLHLVTPWYTLFRPIVRHRCRPYLSRRFPGRGLLMRMADLHRLTLAFGKILVDRAVLGIVGRNAMHNDHKGREVLQGLLAEGRGLIMLTAHVGCWQAGMASLSNLDRNVALLIHREAGDVDRHFFEHEGGPTPFSIIDPAGFMGGALEMLQVLKNGDALCIMGDRVMGSQTNTLPVPFLGDPVPVPISPYKLASSWGAPIAVIFPHKVAADRYALGVTRVIRVPPHLGRDPEAFRPYAEQFIQALEGFTREHPYQFFNFFDMWNPAGS